MATKEKKYPADLKIVLLGATNAGKTCLVSRYIERKFSEKDLTIGSAFVLKCWNSYKIAIWDTGGQERFRGLNKFYCREAGGAILVFDLTNEDSFHSIRAIFAPLLESALPNCICLVVGTKLDLLNDENSKSNELFTRPINYEDGVLLAKQLNPQYENHVNQLYMEVSSLTGENVDQAFDNLLELCLKPNKPNSESELTQSFKLTTDTISKTSACNC